MNSIMKRAVVFGLLLAACIVSLAMQPPPTSAHKKNAPGTDGVYVWSSDFTGQPGHPSFGILPDGSSHAGRPLQVKAFSANKGGEALSAKKGGGGTEAICTYLYSVITYPYTNSFIKAYALSLYRSYGCQPAL